MKTYKYKITATDKGGQTIEVGKAQSKVTSKFICKEEKRKNPTYTGFKIEQR